MKSSISRRLTALEALKPAHIILEIVIDGQAQQLTAPEFVKAGYNFFQARIVAGGSLSDAIAILDTIPSPGIQ